MAHSSLSRARWAATLTGKRPALAWRFRPQDRLDASREDDARIVAAKQRCAEGARCEHRHSGPDEPPAARANCGCFRPFVVQAARSRMGEGGARKERE